MGVRIVRHLKAVSELAGASDHKATVPRVAVEMKMPEALSLIVPIIYTQAEL